MAFVIGARHLRELHYVVHHSNQVHAAKRLQLNIVGRSGLSRSRERPKGTNQKTQVDTILRNLRLNLGAGGMIEVISAKSHCGIRFVDPNMSCRVQIENMDVGPVLRDLNLEGCWCFRSLRYRQHNRSSMLLCLDLR